MRVGRGDEEGEGGWRGGGGGVVCVYAPWWSSQTAGRWLSLYARGDRQNGRNNRRRFALTRSSISSRQYARARSPHATPARHFAVNSYPQSSSPRTPGRVDNFNQFTLLFRPEDAPMMLRYYYFYIFRDAHERHCGTRAIVTGIARAWEGPEKACSGPYQASIGAKGVWADARKCLLSRPVASKEQSVSWESFCGLCNEWYSWFRSGNIVHMRHQWHSSKFYLTPDLVILSGRRISKMLPIHLLVRA